MDTNKATSREIQRSLFSDSLFGELEKMEMTAESRNATLAAAAAEYTEEGLDPDEVIDMLIIDGFPSKLSRKHVEMGIRAVASEPTEGWDFLYEDGRGKIWRGSQLGMTVAGETREEAIDAARELVASSDLKFERIIDAERIEKED